MRNDLEAQVQKVEVRRKPSLARRALNAAKYVAGVGIGLAAVYGGSAKANEPVYSIYPICNRSDKQQTPTIADDGTIIWADNRNSKTGSYRDFDIYAYDPKSGSEYPITLDSTRQSNPKAKGDLVVWEDDRDSTIFRSNPNIYAYRLSTAEEFRVTGDLSLDLAPATNGNEVVWHSCGEDSQFRIKIWNNGNERILDYNNSVAQTNPSISDKYVVWEELSNGKNTIKAFNLTNGNSFYVAQNGCNPHVSDESVIWESNNGGKIHLKNLTNGIEEVVEESLSVLSNSVIDGNTILWVESGNKMMKYGIDTKNAVCISPVSGDYIADISINGRKIAMEVLKEGYKDVDQRDVYLTILGE